MPRAHNLLKMNYAKGIKFWERLDPEIFDVEIAITCSPAAKPAGRFALSLDSWRHLKTTNKRKANCVLAKVCAGGEPPRGPGEICGQDRGEGHDAYTY